MLLYGEWNGSYKSVDMPTNMGDVQNSSVPTSSSNNEYSRTNVQVENVDEADIIKTDGEYIYSLSEDKVVITNVKNPQELKIESTIESQTDFVPVDLILNNDKLIVILESSGTRVEIYDITDKENPMLEKDFEINKTYYTSRVVNNNAYIIYQGYVETNSQEKKIERNYEEDSISKEIELENVHYLTDYKSNYTTIVSNINLNAEDPTIENDMYLFNISNAYVSEKGIYLLKQGYGTDEKESTWDKIKCIFGLKGVLGYEDNYYYNNYTTKTTIYKFDIANDGKLKYNNKAETEGVTLNQYSLDEKDGHLRVALYTSSKGTKIVIFDEKLNQIGETDYIEKNEQMYSSRFMGDKAYLVTYRNTDPLFVIDLSDETNPKVLGKLKISGYSTYLHPYDENHIIGIGMETETKTYRNSQGRVTSTSTVVTGMKVALFDVSNVKNPKLISKQLIGDERTTSAILTNPKALLFSKEKQLLAIPVNNIAHDINITEDENIDTMIRSYSRVYKDSILSEGYLVYNINLEDGITEKGLIEHDETDYYRLNDYTYGAYNYRYANLLIRGLYIGDNLYTVSRDEIKVNKLQDLEEINKLKIKEDE